MLCLLRKHTLSPLSRFPSHSAAQLESQTHQPCHGGAAVAISFARGALGFWKDAGPVGLGRGRRQGWGWAGGRWGLLPHFALGEQSSSGRPCPCPWQAWADAFRSSPDLTGVVHIYEELKRKGVDFPMADLDALSPIHTPQRVSGQAAFPRRRRRTLSRCRAVCLLSGFSSRAPWSTAAARKKAPEGISF